MTDVYLTSDGNLAMTIPVVGRADADEAVAHAWKSLEENHKRAPKPADADEAVAHAWTGFKESVGKEKRTSVSADADEAVAHAWVSFNE